MGHPDVGRGNFFKTYHSFQQAFDFVGLNGIDFKSTTGERIIASQSYASDSATPAITFNGENSRHGNVCAACWGFRQNCSGTRIGQCVEGIDLAMP
jgi:hypothetical protein